MKILVTGGKGFIGSKIVEMLSNDGHHLIVVDNHDTYGIMTKDELDKLYKWRTRNWVAKNVQIIIGDILDRLVCLKAFSHNPDIVIHLATYPRAKIVDRDPILGIPKVINTTTNLLWHAEKFGVRKFVYVSSSMVYGDFVDGMKEDGKTKPKNIYGEAKLTGERLVKLFAKRDNLNYNIIRPSGVYGPGDMPDRVVSKFFDKAMNNQPITLHNGENKVDFTYRRDAAGKATSLRTLAEKIIALTGSESEIEDIGDHMLYPMRGTLDIGRARDLLNYEPEFTLDEGLASYYDWLKNRNGI